MNAERGGTGDGTLASPFRTITEALNAAALRRDKPRRVHVGPGVYDESLGEQFPLRIPEDVSIEGAGSDKTMISGRGPAWDELNFNGEFMTTLIAGHPESVSRIANVALRPGPAAYGGVGIYCNSGNAPRDGEPDVAPSLVLHGLDVAAYSTAVSVTHSSFGDVPGCNLALTSSTISDGQYGIFAAGCRGTSIEQHVSIQVGDGTPTGGNEFKNLRLLDLMGAGIFTHHCTRASVTCNHFHASNLGIYMEGVVEYLPGADHAIIENNHFEDLDHAGVWLWGGRTVVDSLSNNRFERILTDQGEEPVPGFGLRMSAGQGPEPPPKVVRARNNSFRMNGVAVEIQSVSPLTPDVVSDFGTPGDKGLNIFSCNSTRAGIAGGDVRLDVANAAAVTLPFSGNTWDHVPPTSIQTSLDEPEAGNGADIGMSSSNQAQIDTSDASLALETCPDGWVP